MSASDISGKHGQPFIQNGMVDKSLTISRNKPLRCRFLRLAVTISPSVNSSLDRSIIVTLEKAGNEEDSYWESENQTCVPEKGYRQGRQSQPFPQRESIGTRGEDGLRTLPLGLKRGYSAPLTILEIMIMVLDPWDFIEDDAFTPKWKFLVLCVACFVRTSRLFLFNIAKKGFGVISCLLKRLQFKCSCILRLIRTRPWA